MREGRGKKMREGGEKKGGAGRKTKEGSKKDSVRVMFTYVPAHTLNEMVPSRGKEIDNMCHIYIYI